MHKIAYLILFILFLIANNNAYAVRYGLVVSKRAVVYSDKKLESPIGFIRAGKKIMIGETERRRGSIISTVVTGRIVWVKLSDIAIETEDYKSTDRKVSKRFTISEEEFRDKNEKAEDTLFNNNFIHFSFGIFNLDEEFEQFSNDLGVEPKLHSENFNIDIVHRTPYHRSFWSMGLAYYTQSHDEYKWSAFIGQFTYYWSLIKSRVFTIDLYGGVMITGDFKLITNNLTTTLTSNDSGNALGYKFGGQLKLFPYSAIGLVAGLSNQYFIINELGPITTSVNPETELNSIGGINIYFGLSWKL
ncbi:MAG: hypothetical protein HN576_06705 [Bacteriovoracaceae bacterium]|jgi:hypothetical protein|nr:hypothetical protein [Bacteriovoracaceae bacterium]